MSYRDVYSVEQLVKLRLAERRSEGERQRLIQRLQREGQGVFIRLGRGLLSMLGRLLQRLGRHLERCAPAATPELRQRASSS
jgi:hypothetical protein